jgi:hypothetical protein
VKWAVVLVQHCTVLREQEQAEVDRQDQIGARCSGKKQGAAGGNVLRYCPNSKAPRQPSPNLLPIGHRLPVDAKSIERGRGAGARKRERGRRAQAPDGRTDDRPCECATLLHKRAALFWRHYYRVPGRRGHPCRRRAAGRQASPEDVAEEGAGVTGRPALGRGPWPG